LEKQEGYILALEEEVVVVKETAATLPGKIQTALQ
jgi:hypothetical protein